MKRIWIVMVTDKKFHYTSVSQEAYSNLVVAQIFCAQRGDRPKKIDNMKYESASNIYTITDVTVK